MRWISEWSLNGVAKRKNTKKMLDVSGVVACYWLFSFWFPFNKFILLILWSFMEFMEFYKFLWVIGSHFFFRFALLLGVGRFRWFLVLETNYYYLKDQLIILKTFSCCFKKKGNFVSNFVSNSFESSRFKSVNFIIFVRFRTFFFTFFIIV